MMHQATNVDIPCALVGTYIGWNILCSVNFKSSLHKENMPTTTTSTYSPVPFPGMNDVWKLSHRCLLEAEKNCFLLLQVRTNERKKLFTSTMIDEPRIFLTWKKIKMIQKLSFLLWHLRAKSFSQFFDSLCSNAAFGVIQFKNWPKVVVKNVPFSASFRVFWFYSNNFTD